MGFRDSGIFQFPNYSIQQHSSSPHPREFRKGSPLRRADKELSPQQLMSRWDTRRRRKRTFRSRDAEDAEQPWAATKRLKATHRRDTEKTEKTGILRKNLDKISRVRTLVVQRKAHLFRCPYVLLLSLPVLPAGDLPGGTSRVPAIPQNANLNKRAQYCTLNYLIFPLGI